MEPLRKIIRRARGADGLYIQPRETGPKREQEELHNRERAVKHGKYADHNCGDPNTVDPTGKYLCWKCNMLHKMKCLLVSLKTLAGMKGPSCGEWEKQRTGDFEINVQSLSVDGSGFADAVNGRWGCIVCPYQEKAYETDSLGNTLYCKVWECRVNAEVGCCKVNGNKARELPKDWDTSMDPDEPWEKKGADANEAQEKEVHIGKGMRAAMDKALKGKPS